MKTKKKADQGSRWKPVELVEDGSGSCILILLPRKQYGACLKIVRSKTTAGFLGTIHAYHDESGRPAASCYFKDGYLKNDRLFDYVKPTEITANKSCPTLLAAVFADEPDAEQILTVLVTESSIPSALADAVKEIFAE